jgi:hypothetical protein
MLFSALTVSFEFATKEQKKHRLNMAAIGQSFSVLENKSQRFNIRRARVVEVQAIVHAKG